MFLALPLSSANKCLLKVGAYCAQLEQYQKAIEIYEQVCVFTRTSPTTKVFLTSGVCDQCCTISMLSRLERTQWTTHC